MGAATSAEQARENNAKEQLAGGHAMEPTQHPHLSRVRIHSSMLG